LRTVVAWVDAHRWHAAVSAFVVLFIGSLAGGYWIASRLDAVDRDRLARAALQDMKRTAA